MLHRIGDDFAVTIDKSKHLTDFLKLTGNVLRQQYDAHASNCADRVNAHGILYVLEKPGSSGPERVEHCNACNFVSFYFEELRTCLSESEHNLHETLQDALEVVGEMQKKM